MSFKIPNPDAYAFLDEFRGKDFKGEWPTVVEMFEISCKRYPDNNCFRAFSPKELTFTYSQARKKILEVRNFLLSEGVRPGDKIAV